MYLSAVVWNTLNFSGFLINDLFERDQEVECGFINRFFLFFQYRVSRGRENGKGPGTGTGTGTGTKKGKNGETDQDGQDKGKMTRIKSNPKTRMTMFILCILISVIRVICGPGWPG